MYSLSVNVLVLHVIIGVANAQNSGLDCPEFNRTQFAELSYNNSEIHKCNSNHDCTSGRKCCNYCNYGYKICIEKNHVADNHKHENDNCPPVKPCFIGLRLNKQYYCNSTKVCPSGFKCCKSDCFLHKVCVAPVNETVVPAGTTHYLKTSNLIKFRNFKNSETKPDAVKSRVKDEPEMKLLIATTNTERTLPEESDNSGRSGSEETNNILTKIVPYSTKPSGVKNELIDDEDYVDGSQSGDGTNTVTQETRIVPTTNNDFVRSPPDSRNTFIDDEDYTDNNDTTDNSDGATQETSLSKPPTDLKKQKIPNTEKSTPANDLIDDEDYDYEYGSGSGDDSSTGVTTATTDTINEGRIPESTQTSSSTDKLNNDDEDYIDGSGSGDGINDVTQQTTVLFITKYNEDDDNYGSGNDGEKNIYIITQQTSPESTEFNNPKNIFIDDDHDSRNNNSEEVTEDNVLSLTPTGDFVFYEEADGSAASSKNSRIFEDTKLTRFYLPSDSDVVKRKQTQISTDSDLAATPTANDFNLRIFSAAPTMVRNSGTENSPEKNFKLR